MLQYFLNDVSFLDIKYNLDSNELWVDFINYKIICDFFFILLLANYFGE